MPIQMNSPPENPWGSGQTGGPPPDLDKDVKQLLEKLKHYLPGGSPKSFLIFVLLLFALFVIWNVFYTVPSDSVAVVQRFGKLHAQKEPGLHLKIPFGVDAIHIVPTKRQLKQEFGFATASATNPGQGSRGDYALRETQMVTGDLNAALVEWVVQYRIANPVNYLFEVRDPSETLRYISESVMREVVGDRTVDEVITIGRQDIEFQSLERLREIAQTYAMGIAIDQVQLKNINPPSPVQASFNEVNQAQQEKERLINEARREYNRVIPLAEGEKDQRIREADGYRLQRINEAQGDISRFNALMVEYQIAPEVTQRRIYIEHLERLLPRIKHTFLLDGDKGAVLPIMNLGTHSSVLLGEEQND